MFVLCTIVVIVVISLRFHGIFNRIHLFGYPSRKCVIKSVFSVLVQTLLCRMTPFSYNAQRHRQTDGQTTSSYRIGTERCERASAIIDCSKTLIQCHENVKVTKVRSVEVGLIVSLKGLP